MKPVRNFFNYILTLVLLLAVGAGAVWLLSRSEPANPLTAQEAAATPIAATATLTPTVEATATVTPAQTLPDELPAEQIEPTWTPVIIYPDEPPPTLPPPPPTPTPTAINPNETMLAAVDAYAGGLAISPNDQTLALWIKVEPTPEGRSSNRQIATLDVPSRKIHRLNAYGIGPAWSPDGRQILYNEIHGARGFVEIKVVDKDGKNSKSLIQMNDGLLGRHWVTSERIRITKPDGIVEIDLSGRSVNQKSVTFPPTFLEQIRKPIAHAPNDEIIILEHMENKLLIMKENEPVIEITDVEPSDTAYRQIKEFYLSNDKSQVAYVINEGPNNELWINNLSGSAFRKIYRVEFKSIRNVTWSPDNRTLLVGWGHSGTDNPTILTWLDVESGQQTPVGIHGVGINPIFDHRGKKIFYRRISKDKNNDIERTTIYQLEVKR